MGKNIEMIKYLNYIIGVPVALLIIRLLWGGWYGYVFGKRINIIVPIIIIILGNIIYDIYKYKRG